MMCGGSVRCSGENIMYNGIRHRVSFEAADRATSPQKAVQVNRVRQNGLA